MSIQVSDIKALWRDDLVSFFLGCSFGFERALQEGGIEVRNITEGKNVSMYTTNIQVRRLTPYAVRWWRRGAIGRRRRCSRRQLASLRACAQCTPVGPFSCPMVVSMRPIAADKVETAIEVTGTPACMQRGPVAGEPNSRPCSALFAMRPCVRALREHRAGARPAGPHGQPGGHRH
jgi:uncharacterized protein YcsI (UPF0317 family)